MLFSSKYSLQSCKRKLFLTNSKLILPRSQSVLIASKQNYYISRNNLLQRNFCDNMTNLQGKSLLFLLFLFVVFLVSLYLINIY